jgi:CDP-6-deoxy-D-xylo-4-hexulose-3-dehydrase
MISEMFAPGDIVQLKGPSGEGEKVVLLQRVGAQWMVLPSSLVVDECDSGDSPCPMTVDETALGTRAGAVSKERLLKQVKRQALSWSRRFARLAHGGGPAWIDEPATCFSTEGTVPYAGRVFGEEEVARAVDASLDFWLTLGAEGEAFEQELAARLGVKRSLLVNSGSSANLLAVSALTSPKLPRSRRLFPGDEVITCAAGFPTTVAPILQNGLVPVFIDNDPVTLSPRLEQLEEAYVEGRTKAVIFAHAMGNPFDLSRVVQFCRERELWLIEDNCDALGSRYVGALADGTLLDGWTGTFGDLSTQSFYPPHHLTMGEGGAVNIVRDMKLKLIVESFRDWGRDCWCPSGKDNTCRKRFGWQLGDLPEGYDHKYIYSHLGYNLKPLDVQAAIGRVQLGRLAHFIEQRKANWHYLRAGLDSLGDCLGFSLPIHACGWSADRGYLWPEGEARRSDPSWFGFMMRVLPEAGFSRAEFTRFLDRARIGNRALFGGNLLRQPAFVELRRERPEAVRVAGSLSGADDLMHQAVFVGVYPGLNRAMLDHMIEQIHHFCQPYL